MGHDFQPFKLIGQYTVLAQSKHSAETALVSAIQSKNLDVQVDDQGYIRFSNPSFIATIIRYDYFQGVKSGEVSLVVDPEGKINLRYKLLVSPIGWCLAVAILILILTLPFGPSVEGSIIVHGITIVIGGLIFFMFWREYIRLNLKLFTRRTINRRK